MSNRTLWLSGEDYRKKSSGLVSPDRGRKIQSRGPMEESCGRSADPAQLRPSFPCGGEKLNLSSKLKQSANGLRSNPCSQIGHRFDVLRLGEHIQSNHVRQGKDIPSAHCVQVSSHRCWMARYVNDLRRTHLPK